MYPIYSFMDLSWSCSTSCLFGGDWPGTKGMWVDWMLDPCCHFQLWAHPWPWPWFFKVNFWIAVSQEREGRSTWNERDMSRYGVIPTLWPWPLILTLDFQGQILKRLYLRNGRADWHGTKGMWVDRMLDLSCDFKLWPHTWHWPWIFKVKSLVVIF